MSVEEVVEKYIQLVRKEDFAQYEKEFAHKVQTELNKSYVSGSHELAMVQVIEGIINELKEFSKSIDGIKISTKSIFIHGNKSWVEFEYYGQKVRRELGDLIFILSIIYNGRKYFEKLTISQFKKDNNKLRWDLSNKEQIYLLSRFPSFQGVKGSIIPMKKFNLPNYSGCLGSFNLLFWPGDFAFTSAPKLESFIGNRRSISIDDIFKLWEPPSYFIYPIPFYWPHIEELLYFWRKLWKYGVFIPFSLFCSIGVLGSSHYASNVHDFVDKYLRGCIGELIYSNIGVYNKPALDFLHDLLSAIKKKAQREGRKEVEDFVTEFFDHPYSNGGGGMREGAEFDYEGGGIGIIYTSINLGER